MIWAMYVELFESCETNPKVQCNVLNAFFVGKELSITHVDISWLKANPVKILPMGIGCSFNSALHHQKEPFP